jgi:Cu(I)/Ag(I) efflux system periplasmic protein CusF
MHMKSLVIAITLAAAAVTAFAADGMKGMDMKGDMKGMDMKDVSPTATGKDSKSGKHVAKGTVKSVDAKAGTVTLDHDPVKSMNWPAMSMSFKVHDKALMDKLGQGKKVEVEFEQRGKDYVITSAK